MTKFNMSGINGTLHSHLLRAQLLWNSQGLFASGLICSGRNALERGSTYLTRSFLFCLLYIIYGLTPSVVFTTALDLMRVFAGPL